MANRFWVGGTGTWNGSDTTHWSASSGGSSGASVPGVLDAVFFDANSFSTDGQTVTVITLRSCGPFNASAVDQSIIFTGAATTNIEARGNITLNSKITFTTVELTCVARTGENFSVDTAGAILDRLQFDQRDNATPIINLNSDVNATVGFIISGQGTVNLNGHVINAGYALLASSGDPVVVDFNDTIFNLSGAALVSIGGRTDVIFGVNAPTDDITLNDSFIVNINGPGRIFTGSNNIVGILGNFRIFPFNQTVILELGGVTLNELSLQSTADDTATIKMYPVGFDTTINDFIIHGFKDNLALVRSTTDGVDVSMVIGNSSSVSYVDVKDNHASGIIPIDDSLGGIDSGNNENWIFGNTFYNAGTEGRLIIAPEAGTTINMTLNATDITANRTGTFQDSSGTFAWLTDITVTGPGGTDGQVQYNNNEVFGGTLLNYDNSSSNTATFFVADSDNIPSLNFTAGNGITDTDGGQATLRAGNGNGTGAGGGAELSAGQGAPNGGLFLKQYSGLFSFTDDTWVALLDMSALTADRSFELPDASGTIAVSAGGTGGTGSAGAGKQYVEINVDGVVYKVLHDGTV